MTLAQRVIYAKLIIALYRDDKEEIVRIYFNEINTKTKYMNKDIAYKLITFYNDRDTKDIMGK